MGIEFELKYALSPETQEAVAAIMDGPCRRIEMETAYYDTPAGDLAARRYTLRRRLENGRSVCTLKTPAGDARNEWETECPGIREAIPELCKLGGPAELLWLTEPGLVQVCAARFLRRAWTLDTGSCRVELALDRGALLGGGRELPLCELEVELISGSREDAAAYARMLAQRFSLEPEPKSKFRRALDLAKEAD